MKSEIAVTRRTTYRVEENVVNLEKAKKKDERPVLTLEEMREKMIKSPAYLEAIEEMMKEAKAAAEIKRNAPKTLTPPKL